MDDSEAWCELSRGFASSCWIKGIQVQVFATDAVVYFSGNCSFDACCMRFGKTCMINKGVDGVQIGEIW